jgi:hypothetical protein
MVVLCTVNLTDDVLDTSKLTNDTNSTTGDCSGTFLRGKHQHFRGAEFTGYVKRNRSLKKNHLNQVLFSLIRAFFDRVRYFTGFTETETNASFAITHYNER